MEQKYVIKNADSFLPKHIFECGQCFRWNLENDGSYTGVIKEGVLNVKNIDNNIVISGNVNGNIKNICYEYFNLETDYFKIKNSLCKIDDNLKIAVKYGYGIRILKQDFWETVISFIISANNNIPRIKKIIERICKNYGNKIMFNNKEYYLFPTAKQLSKASVQDFRNLGLGFRDKRVYETTKIFLENPEFIKELIEENDVNILREKLKTLSGVGDKVADCIMLFSLKKYEVFPVDVWVRRVMNELYIHSNDETKINKKQLRKFAEDKFENLAGFAQQYLFYWKREN